MIYGLDVLLSQFGTISCVSCIDWWILYDWATRGAQCWRTINKKMLEPSKKDTVHSNTKKKPQWDVRRGVIAINSNPIPPRWATQKLENNYITEVFPQEWEFWALGEAPQPGGLVSGGEAPRVFGFEGQWDLITGNPPDWEKQKLHSLYIFSSCILQPREKAVTS